jgi:hypothetical protein
MSERDDLDRARGLIQDWSDEFMHGFDQQQAEWLIGYLVEADKLREAAGLAADWFGHFGRKPAHEEVDISGANYVHRKLLNALGDTPNE